jgi:ferredoxin-NADP reductase
MPALVLLALAGAALLFGAGLLLAGFAVRTARRRRERRERALERPMQLIVTRREEEAGHLLALRLEARDGGRLPPFAPGQHVLLAAPAGKDGRILRRAYSLAAWSRRPRHYELGIKREARGQVSNWAWDHLHPGSPVSLLPPRGEFTVGGGRHEAVLIGAGIGITPLRAMLHELLAQDRPVVLHQAARHEAELLYRGEFEALAATHPRLRYLPTLTRAGAGWQGGRGRLDAGRVLAACADPGCAEFHLCAAKAMMNELRAGLEAAGVPARRIHHEAFGVGAARGASGCRVQIGGWELVSAGEPSLLATLEIHDLAPESECRAGTCGRCRLRLLEGRVKWLLDTDLALARDEILPCVCLPEGDIRLARPLPAVPA